MGQAVISFRRFRNTDPPALADVWNEAYASRSAYPLRTPALLERWVFSKPYFDPDGLIVAVDSSPGESSSDQPSSGQASSGPSPSGERVIGYILAGFGPNAELNALDRTQGVICLLALRPAYRRRGIGRELVRRAEQYLLRHGARVLRAGPRWPYCPYGFGLYGGTNCPGFLLSDTAADPFFRSLGYQPAGTTTVFHKRLEEPIAVADPRLQSLRRRYEIVAYRSAAPPSWWHECVWGTLEPVEFRMIDKLAEPMIAGRALVWELEGYGWRWGLPAAGVLDIQVRDDLRRQGLGKLLLVHVLRFLREQYFGLCEIQATESQEALIGLCRSVGMEEVDRGITYCKDAAAALSPEPTLTTIVSATDATVPAAVTAEPPPPASVADTAASPPSSS